MLLAVETSTARSSVALAEPDGTVVAASELGRDRRHGEFVAPAIAELLHHAGVTMDDLTAVAAGTGPGLYTGLRVGLVTAATIAATRELPCVGVPGPDVLAHRARHSGRTIAVVLDARRREVYLGTYQPDPVAPRPLRALSVTTPAGAAAELAMLSTPLLLVGDGGPAVLAAEGAPEDAVLGGPDLAQPLAADLAPVAAARFAAGEGIGVEAFVPTYLREADAAIGWDQRGRLRGGGGS